jgi:transposase InsO family protein
MEGVQHHLTTLYTPQQNGVVERQNQTVLGMARSMLKAMRMPDLFWGGGCAHGCLHPQQIADEEPGGDHPV